MTDRLEIAVPYSSLEQSALLSDVNLVNGVLTAVAYYRQLEGLDPGAIVELDHIGSLGEAQLGRINTAEVIAQRRLMDFGGSNG